MISIKKGVLLSSLTIMFVVGFFFVVKFAIGETGTINACVDKYIGLVRIVSSPTKCFKTETALSWNLSGPPGPTVTPQPFSQPLVCIADTYNSPICDFSSRTVKGKYFNIQGPGIGSRLAGKDLNNSYIINASFYGVDLKNINFSNSVIEGTRFNNADLSGVNFTNADLSGSDLSQSTLTGIIWFNTTCPDQVVSNDCSAGHIN
jgi:hypothetical protein